MSRGSGKFKEPISVLNELVQSFYSQKTILITTIYQDMTCKTLGQEMTRHYFLESSIAYEVNPIHLYKWGNRFKANITQPESRRVAMESQSLKPCSRHLLTWWKVKVLVIQSCLTLCNSMDYSPSGSSAHRILQARIPEWVAISFSRGPSQPKDWTQISHTAGGFLNVATKQFWQRRQWQPTPVLLPRKSHGRRSLVGCSPWGR